MLRVESRLWPSASSVRRGLRNRGGFRSNIQGAFNDECSRLELDLTGVGLYGLLIDLACTLCTETR